MSNTTTQISPFSTKTPLVFDLPLTNHLAATLPVLFLLTASLLLVLFGALVPGVLKPSRSAAHGKQEASLPKVQMLTPPRVVGWLSIQSLFFTLLLLLACLARTGHTCASHINSVSFGSPHFMVDGSIYFMQGILILSSLFAVLAGLEHVDHFRSTSSSWEHYILVLIASGAALLLVCSSDLLSLYLALEMQSLCFYVLAAIQRQSEWSVEAGLKYFILGALSSGLLLFGCSLLYAFTGCTHFEHLGQLASCSSSNGSSELFLVQGLWPVEPSPAGQQVGLLLLVGSLLFKLGAVPFHMWIPDVYEGAPTPVGAFFAIVPKLALLSLVMRICVVVVGSPDGLATFSWQPFLLVCSIASMIFGTLGALSQFKYKRLLAFSSIAHVGYLLLAVSIGTSASIEAVLVYIFFYLIMTIGTWWFVLCLFETSPNTLSLDSPGPFLHPSGASSPGIISDSSHHLDPNYFVPHHFLPCFALLPSPNAIGPRGAEALIAHGATLSSCSPSSTCLDRAGAWDLFSSRPINHPFPSAQRAGSPMLGGRASIPLVPARRSTSFTSTHKYLDDFSCLAKTNPLLASTFATLLFSNAGIPPLAGFYGKFQVFLCTIQSQMYLSAFIAITSSTMGAFYAIRMVRILYFSSPSPRDGRLLHKIPPNGREHHPITKANALILALSLFITLFFFLDPSLLFMAAHGAALVLCS